MRAKLLIKVLILFLLAGCAVSALYKNAAGWVPTTGEAEVSVRSMMYDAREDELTTLVTVKNTAEDEESYDFIVTVEVYHDPEELEPELVGESDVHTTGELDFEETRSLVVRVTLSEPLEKTFQASAFTSKDDD